MAPRKATAGTPDSIELDQLKTGHVTLRLLGTTPFYCNAMSAKAKRTLLLGGGKKTAAEKKDIKHDPEQEFRDSIYRLPKGPTLLGFPAPGVKGAMATAALETPGIQKSAVQRLIFIPQDKISIWGIPYLKMDVVRSADMARTPDVRTRAFLPRWAAEVEVRFVQPTLSLHSVVSLLSNAGIIAGIGDFRQEKGKGSFGCFEVFGSSMGQAEETWAELMEEGREAQEVAMTEAQPADAETTELMAILRQERMRRAA